MRADGTGRRLRSRENTHTHTQTQEREFRQERAQGRKEESEGAEPWAPAGVQLLVGTRMAPPGASEPAPPRAGLCGSSLPCRQGPGDRGGASEGKGTRADAGVDTLVQGQVVALLQVQEEEPVRGLAWVKTLVLQSSLLDLEGACGGGEGGTQQREVLGTPNSPSCPTPPGCRTGCPLGQKHSSPFCLPDPPLSFRS